MWTHHVMVFRNDALGEIYLCEHELPHAFVLGHGPKMGTMVAKWLETSLRPPKITQ
jgi:hypothetical protein